MRSANKVYCFEHPEAPDNIPKLFNNLKVVPKFRNQSTNSTHIGPRTMCYELQSQECIHNPTRVEWKLLQRLKIFSRHDASEKKLQKQPEVRQLFGATP